MTLTNDLIVAEMVCWTALFVVRDLDVDSELGLPWPWPLGAVRRVFGRRGGRQDVRSGQGRPGRS